VGQITRICNHGLIVAALLMPTPALAKQQVASRSVLRDYALARVAQQAGDDGRALAGFASALAREPRNQTLALRVVREAVRQGDMPLALKAVAQIDRSTPLPPDIELLIVAERVKLGDWRGATDALTRLEADPRFANMGPIMRAWIALSTKGGDPFKTLDGLDRRSYEALFSPEHRAYLLMATGAEADGLTLVRALALSKGGLPALRLSAASMLLKAGKRDAALTLLSAQQPELAAAHLYIENGGKSLSPQIRTAAQGIAQFMARYSAAFLDERAPNFALIFGRYARYLDPVNPFVALTAARAMAGSGLNTSAEAGFAVLAGDPVVGASANDARIDLLETLGRPAEAISLAASRAARPGAGVVDNVRLGDVLGRAGKYAEASLAYDAALKASEVGDGTAEQWALWYLKGTSLDRAGNWPAGKVALQKAVTLAPNQAAPLNHLGYGMLERRENVADALVLIRRAYALQPDDIGITDSLGWALYLNGDFDGATDALERVVVAQPTEPALGEHLGDVYWSAGRRVDARYAWRAAAIFADGDAATRLKSKIEDGLNQKNAAR
jgi:tetratricopeptide (TPR) repeat protein